MGELSGALGTSGVGAFNDLYLRVTSAIKSEIGGEFPPGGFVETLDVHFANRYFLAVGAWFRWRNPADAPKPWTLLFERHDRPTITDLQFAAAGVNTYINFDLPHALVRTWRDHAPDQDDPLPVQRPEYDYVTGIFARLYKTFRNRLFSAPLELFDQCQISTGLDLASHVAVDRARDLALADRSFALPTEVEPAP